MERSEIRETVTRSPRIPRVTIRARPSAEHPEGLSQVDVNRAVAKALNWLASQLARE